MCASDPVCRIAVAKNRKFAIERGMSSVRASEIGLPVSIDSARANFSKSRSIRSAIRSKKRDRSAAGCLDQPGVAFSAAATAKSTSYASLSATCEYVLPVAGSILSRYRLLIGSTNSPLMKLLMRTSVWVIPSCAQNIQRFLDFARNDKRWRRLDEFAVDGVPNLQ